MKTLILLRHAEAASPSGMLDFERPLTAAGQGMAAMVGKNLAAKGLWPDGILCSAARRTRETCEGLLDIWRGDMQPAVTYDPVIYQAEPEALIRLVQEQDNKDACLMLIGHNPAIHRLSLLLPKAGEVQKYPSLTNYFPPASCAVLQLAGRGWDDVVKSRATLLDFFTP